ncbi:hypothetical protein EJ08DRAFT_709835 [Tothia fuscella]|uniref:RTA1-domain-containing protein n=1 Tax=Tothia fuscella TaxID=1048955 RepID=A0A9P4NUK6_9PEZI|nr:hypothetical protein EJ08DRAFT_709835 [Tothia fuscella]
MTKCLPLNDPTNQWSYCPSTALAAIFAILFASTLFCHIFQAYRHRKAFCLVIILGALSETLAFAFRILSARHPAQKGSYDASFLLVLLAPLAINAFDYMLLGRLIMAFLPNNTKVLGVKGSRMGMLFVCSDIISFIVQIGGGLVSLSKKASTAKLGLHVVTGGLIFQQILIAIFIVMTFRFTYKLKRFNSFQPSSSRHGPRRLLYVLRASLCLITFRIICRLVDFCTSQTSSVHIYIDHHEFFVYVCDAGPMFIALVLMNIWHPGKVFKEKVAYASVPYQEYQMGRY